MEGKKKEYQRLGEGRLTVLGAVVKAFVSCPRIGPIVIAIPLDSDEGAALSSLPPEIINGPELNRIHFVSGGPTRRSSVHNALLRLEPYNPSHVLIHDGARPWIKPELIEKITDAVIRYGAVIPALPLSETPKEIAPGSGSGNETGEGPLYIKKHLRRAELCTAQTPQAFRFSEILAAHEKAREREEREKIEYTDDAEVWGEFIGQVAVISGDPENRKITYPGDLG